MFAVYVDNGKSAGSRMHSTGEDNNTTLACTSDTTRTVDVITIVHCIARLPMAIVSIDAYTSVSRLPKPLDYQACIQKYLFKSSFIRKQI